MPIYYFLSFFVIKKNKKNELKSKACSSWKRCAQISVQIAFFNIFFEWIDPCKWHVTNPFVLAYTQKSLSYICDFHMYVMSPSLSIRQEQCWEPHETCQAVWHQYDSSGQRKQQESTERRNKLNKLQSDGKATNGKINICQISSEQLTSCSSQAHQEEAELQALFDCPTQYVSGRLSPPSVNCTPESKTEPVAPAEQKSSSAAIKSAPVDAPKTTKVDFDDDWENDDLLNDSFVLEMTQNPVPLNVAQKQSTAQPESCSSRCNFCGQGSSICKRDSKEHQQNQHLYQDTSWS